MSPLPLALAWQDYAVVGGYVALLAGMAVYFARRQRGRDEYFLASRSVPWFAVGLSLIATLLSSLTYLSEPGEVWQSGATALFGKVIAMGLEATLVWLFVIPVLMRYRFTSAYEYLGYRFGTAARVWGVALFVVLVVTWMGFVVLAMARAVGQVTGIDLSLIIALVGVVGTAYTVFGGLRAVIWTEVLQVLLMIGGCFIALIYVGVTTNSTPADWFRATLDFRASHEGTGLRFFSADPYLRTTVVTFALTMFVWHLCTHLGNQMAVQRYFSTADLRAARRSFVVAIATGLLVNGLLVCVGMALLYLYGPGERPLPQGLRPLEKRDADMVFPAFMVTELPPGLAGALLTAVLAAAMSTIDSAINALAAVLSVERDRLRGTAGGKSLGFAKRVTVAAGVCITLSAYGLNELSANKNMVEMMPRSFNCFLVPLGGMFLVGFFLPHVGGRAVLVASFSALATAIGLAYSRQLGLTSRDVSFTLVLPGALAALLTVAVVLGLFDRPPRERVAGLTYFTRHQRPAIPEHLIAPA
jgi:SSS family solute:Na+ symporter